MKEWTYFVPQMKLLILLLILYCLDLSSLWGSAEDEGGKMAKTQRERPKRKILLSRI